MEAILFRLSAPLQGKRRAIGAVILAPTSAKMVDLSRRTSAISWVALLAVTMAIYRLRFKLPGRPGVVFVGKNAVVRATVKGQTACNPSHSFISNMWMVEAPFCICLWFDRIPSGSDIADFPTLFEISGFAIINSNGICPFTGMARLYASYFYHCFRKLTNGSNECLKCPHYSYRVGLFLLWRMFGVAVRIGFNFRYPDIL